jgi:ElaB/YqjD/DUF883 family membrane-anchored ribosome-binding protein
MFTRVRSRSRAEARKAARVLNQRPMAVANEELRILVATVEDLIESLGTAVDPELQRLRKQLQAALASAKAAIAGAGAQVRDQAEELTDQAAAFVQERPWTSLGLLAVCVLAIGLWTSRAALTD